MAINGSTGIYSPNCKGPASGSLVLVGSSLNRGMFALVANKNIADVKSLKGKKIAIGQIGDAPYGYLLALLGKSGIHTRDVEWVPVGTDVSGRAAALQSAGFGPTQSTACIAAP